MSKSALSSLSFEEALILAEAELIAGTALQAGFPPELARIVAENCVRYPGMVEQLRDRLKLGYLGISIAMMGPEAFLESMMERDPITGEHPQ